MGRGFESFDHLVALTIDHAHLSKMKETVKGMKDKESAYKVALQGQTTTTSAEKTKLANLNKEYSSLNSKISDLEKETNELYEQRQAISLG